MCTFIEFLREKSISMEMIFIKRISPKNQRAAAARTDESAFETGQAELRINKLIPRGCRCIFPFVSFK
jgi:hypothetical protein